MKAKNASLACAVLFFVSACASNSGVVQTGKDTYIISKQAATGFTGLGTLKADAMKEAYGQCAKTGQSVKVVDSQESKPPFVLGNFPRVDVTFRCVAEQ
jgi:hypothetical protein